MTFTVTYRKADGSIATETVDASSRSDCFAHMKSRDRIVINVKQTAEKNIKSKGKTSSTNHEGILLGGYGKKVFLLFAMAAIVATVYFCFSKKSPQAYKDQKKKDKTSRIIATVQHVNPSSSSTNAVKSDKVKLLKEPPAKKWPDMSSTSPADIGRAIKELGIRPGMYHYKNVAEVFADTNSMMTAEERNTTLNTATEQHLFVIASAPLDRPIPPMPPSIQYDENDFIKSLSNKIQIWEGDTEEMARRKERVIEMKEQMKDLIKGGATLAQAFAEVEAAHNRRANLHMLFKSEYFKMLRKNDPSAEEFRERANSTLKKNGCVLIGD